MCAVYAFGMVLQELMSVMDSEQQQQLQQQQQQADELRALFQACTSSKDRRPTIDVVVLQLEEMQLDAPPQQLPPPSQQSPPQQQPQERLSDLASSDERNVPAAESEAELAPRTAKPRARCRTAPVPILAARTDVDIGDVATATNPASAGTPGVESTSPSSKRAAKKRFDAHAEVCQHCSKCPYLKRIRSAVPSRSSLPPMPTNPSSPLQRSNSSTSSEEKLAIPAAADYSAAGMVPIRKAQSSGTGRAAGFLAFVNDQDACDLNLYQRSKARSPSVGARSPPTLSPINSANNVSIATVPPMSLPGAASSLSPRPPALLEPSRR